MLRAYGSCIHCQPCIDSKFDKSNLKDVCIDKGLKPVVIERLFGSGL